MSRITPIMVTLLGVLAGCHNPRFQEASEVRLERIRGHLADYAAHDAAGPARLHATVEVFQSMGERRAASLQATCDLCRRGWERDIDRWRDERPLCRSRIHAILRGHPEDIDETWAKMVY